MVDPPAVFPVESAQSKSESVLDDGPADGGAEFVRRAAVVRTRKLRAHVHRVCMQIGRGLNEADRAALGSGTEERSLRSAQHLDTLEIEQSRECVERREGDVAPLNRRIVDIDAHRRSAGRGIDAANVDVRIFVVEITGGRGAVALKGDARGEACQIIDAAQPLDIQFLLGKCRRADGDVLQTLRAARRRDHNFLEAGAGRGIALGSPGVVDKHPLREPDGAGESQ